MSFYNPSDDNRKVHSSDSLLSSNGQLDEKKESICSALGTISSGGSQLALTAVNSTVCRICHTNTQIECLISPCNCKGSLAYVHLSCLERWLNQASRSYCELCMYQYNSIQTQRYGLWEGIRLWTRHPRNRNHVQSDLLISILLTIVTVGLVAICSLGMQYFVIEGRRVGISKTWTESVICVFLIIVISSYSVTMYLLIKDQVMPWYNWWKSTVDVRLRLSQSVTNAYIQKDCSETAI